MNYLFWYCWPVKSHRVGLKDLQTLQIIVNAPGYPLGLSGETAAEDIACSEL